MSNFTVLYSVLSTDYSPLSWAVELWQSPVARERRVVPIANERVGRLKQKRSGGDWREILKLLKDSKLLKLTQSSDLVKSLFQVRGR